ncbi:MAG: cytochrome c [Polaromonas sp.]
MKWFLAFLLACCGTFPPAAHSQSQHVETRGELLYSTHCIACHSSQFHWRDRKLATDWATLKAEVDRWQTLSGLMWSDDDVLEVAQYLNARHYRFPSPQTGRWSGDAGVKSSR